MLLSNLELLLFNQIFARQKQPVKTNEMQQQILNWLSIILYQKRLEWTDNRKNSVSLLYSLDKKTDALKRALVRDKRYAPFRKKFKIIQRNKVLEYRKLEKNLSANSFVLWFLKNNPQNLEIPYCLNNQKNKLIQLAQANNREFKKAFECKS